MSELRVDNIVSQDGSAAPIYSKALNVTGGGSFNNPSGIITTGTLNVSGSTSFGDITGTIGTLVVTNDGTVGGALTVTGDLTVNGTTTTIDTAVTSVDSLAVDGVITTGGKPVATTGKAIAMAMVFGG